MSSKRTIEARRGIFRIAAAAAPVVPALLSGLIAGPTANAAITDGLLGHYRLDETDTGSTDVLNSAPSAAENGVRTPTISLNQPAIVNTGYGFDGVNNNDQIALGSSIALTTPNTDKLTISAWVNPSFYRTGTAAASRHTIVGTNVDLTFSLYGSGNLIFNYKDVNTQGDNTRNSSGGNNLAGGMTVPLNQWSNVAVARDGADIFMYINGIMVAHQTGNAGNFYQRLFDHDADPGTPNSTAFYIGTYNGGAARDFDGVMDDVGIWSGRALSHQEIAMMAGLSGLTHAVALGSSEIDSVLNVYATQGSAVSAGGYQWSYTDAVPAPSDGSTLYVGKHYTGTDGNFYIILDGATDAYTGVTTAAIAPVVQAIWDGGGNGNWSSGPNWAGDVTPNFTSAASTVPVFTGTGQAANNDVANAFVAGILFDANAGSFTITGNGFTVLSGASKVIRNDSLNTQTLSTGAITIGGAGINAAAGDIIVNSDLNVGTSGITTLRAGKTLTVNGKISGAGAIHKRDGGTLALTNAASDFTGTLTVFEGIVSASSAGALGSSAGTMAAGGGASTGRYELNGSMNLAKPVSLGLRTGTIASYAPSLISNGTSTLSGGIGLISGGTLAGVSSESGKLLITGSVLNNLGSSGAVNLLLGGAGEGEISGGIGSGTGTGAFGVTKVGAGTWTLSGGGANTYAGPTNVVAGTLKVTNGPLFSSAASKTTITVESGAVLDVSAIGNYEMQIGQTLRGKGTVKAGTLVAYDDNAIKPGDDTTGNVGTLSVQGNLSLLNQFAPPAPGSNLTFDLAMDTTVGGGVNDLIDVTGDLALNSSAGAILVNVNPTQGSLAAGSYRLINYSGTKSGSSSWTVNLPLASSSYRATPTVDDTPAGHVDLVVPANMSIDLTWKGDGSANNWNVNADSNWNNNTEKFYQADRVTFDNSSTNTTVNITEPVFPGAITVNSSQDYTFIGNGSLNTLSGGGDLTKLGTGNLTLTNVNTGTWNVNYTGRVIINQGTISVAHVGQLAQNTAADHLILDGGALRYIGAIQNNTGRLFTLGANGGTLDSGGTGTFNLSSAGTIEFTGSGPRTLTLAGSFAGTNGVAGMIGDGPGGATAIVKNGATGWALSNASNTYSGGVTVNEGTLTVTRIPGGPVAVNGGALNVTEKPGANNAAGTSVMTSIAFAGGPAAPTGKLDLANNAAVVDYAGASPINDVRQYLLAGISAGNNGITSSSADANTRLGYAEASQIYPSGGTFAGVTVDADMVLIKFTYGGDSNLDGKVDVGDLGNLASNWQQSALWSGGDFDYNGTVNVGDLGILATNWQQGVTTPTLGPSFSEALAALGLPAIAVPEPAALGIMATALAAGSRRRRRA